MANLSNINDKLVVTDAGNVGIGDLHTSIDAPLTIQAGLNARAIRIRGRYLDQISELDFYRFDNSTILARIESLSDSFNINTYPSNPITFKTANVEKMRISSSGNVGIGLPSSSPSPSAKLQVYSTAATNIFMTGYGTATQNNWGAQNVMFVKTDNGLLISKENAANNTNRLFNFYNDANGYASLYMYKGDATAQVLLNTNGNSYFLGGSIGIGATDPIVTAWGNTTNTRQLTLVGSAYAVINLQGSNNSLTQYSIGVGDGRFYMAYDRQAVKHRLVVDSTGNVGVGVTSPRDKLTVFTAGVAEEEIALRLVNPIGYDNAGSGASIIFAQDRNASENGPMAKIRSSQAAAGTSCCGDLLFSTYHSGISGMTDKYKITSSGEHNFTTDGSFTTGFNYSFRDAVGISNPNSVSASVTPGYVLSVGRTTSGSIAGGIISQGESHFVRGISFGQSGQGQVLANYEEGTWTPVIAHNDGSGVVPISVQAARYIRVGQLVYVSAYLTNINPAGNAGGSGNYYGIRGFPFQPENYGAWQVVYASGSVTAYGGYSSSASLYFMSNGTNGQRSQAHVNGAGVNAWGSNKTIMMNCVYNIL